MFFGDIQITDDLSAAASAFHRYRPHPATGELPQPPRPTPPAPHADRSNSSINYSRSQQPTEPHYHLAFLAVPPTRSGAVAARRCWPTTAARLDRIDLPAWTAVPALPRHPWSPWSWFVPMPH